MSTTKHANDTIFDNCYATEFSRILDATPDDGKKEAIANILSYSGEQGGLPDQTPTLWLNHFQGVCVFLLQEKKKLC